MGSASNDNRLAFLGLGGNQGDRHKSLRRALETLNEHGLIVEAVSGLYETPPMYVTDQGRFASVKPLLWAWTQVDGTPFGRSMATGIPFRRMLAERVFSRAGHGLKIFPGVELSLGYNIEAGDGVVLHRNVYLDDIGGIELHDGASLADEVHVYSHTHDVRESDDVILKRTVIGRGVRVAYHATVLAGSVLSDDAMLGAMAVATRAVDPHVVALGVPARPHLRKDRNGDARFRELVVDARSRAPTPEIRANPDFANRVASDAVPPSIDERLASSESSLGESAASEPSPRES